MQTEAKIEELESLVVARAAQYVRSIKVNIAANIRLAARLEAAVKRQDLREIIALVKDEGDADESIRSATKLEAAIDALHDAKL
jgi:hypothetical protein